MTEQSPASRRDAEAQLVAKAWKDEQFAQQLRSDPRAAIERELGVKLPATITVQVLEESPQTLYLVVPAKPEAVSEELSDADLAAVAGGTAPVQGCDGGGPGGSSSCYVCW